MKRNIFILLISFGAVQPSFAAFTKLNDYMYDCERPKDSKDRILAVGPALYLDVFWQLFNDLKDQDYARESVGVTPEQSACIGNMKVTLAQLYKRAPESAKKNPMFSLRVGQYQSFNAQYKQAEESFKQAVKLNPASVTANVEMARVLERRAKKKDQEIYLRNAVDKGQAKNAEEKDMLAEAYNKLVEAFEPDSRKALELVKRWILLEPNSVNARTAQADLGLELKEPEMVNEAVSFLLSPDKEYYAGHGAYMRKDYKEAAKQFRAYLKLEDRERDMDVDNARYLVKALYADGQKDEARKEAEIQLARFATDDELIKLHEQIVLSDLAEKSDPVKELEEASEKNPRSRVFKFKIIEVLLKGLPLKVEDSDPVILRQALAYDDKILEQNAEDIQALYWKAFIRYQSRAFNDADITMSRVVEKMHDRNARAMLQMPAKNIYIVAANIKSSLGYTDEAKALMREGAKLGASTGAPADAAAPAPTAKPKATGKAAKAHKKKKR